MRLLRVHPWRHRKDGAIQDGECFEFGRAFTKWKWTFENKRMVPLVYLIYLLNIYVKRKWTFFGFTCPLIFLLVEKYHQSNATVSCGTCCHVKLSICSLNHLTEPNTILDFKESIVSRSGYIWIRSGARDQESTNHGARFVELTA